MRSLAYLVAFLLLMVVIGGPVALGLTFVRVQRFRTLVILASFSIPLGVVSTFLGLILILNNGSFGAKVLGVIGISTGAFAIRRIVRSLRNFR